MIPIGFMLFQKKLSFIMEIAEKGLFCIGFDTLFVLYIGFKNIFQGNVSISWYEDVSTINSHWPLFTNASLATTIGLFCTSFMVHNAVVPMVRKNQNQANNSRDLKIAYTFVTCTYVLAGVIGSMGVYNNP